MRAPKRALAASVLGLESFVVLFAGLVAFGLARRSDGAAATGGDTRALVVCAVLALACLLGSGLLRRPWGYVLGSVLQAAVLATGFWVPAMFFLGAVFAALWVTALRVGARIERERAEYAASHPAP
ncbi:DUF4233 domain-containing protein [Kineosporia sp. R_H_3]|uniref:DUF4233 domain-containing protein n=1 Tax=Kineosporia sp. R_H_3 TaxID=1961848 RepID=UPI000B4BBC37|nr:DUF4233 domain-containing protein [Kineosporia sp. R_H_3]